MNEVMVEIPLRVAQKAKRFYRPLHPYVAKRIAELRNEGKVEEVITDPIIEETIIEPVIEQPPEKKKTKKKKAKK
jgi:ribosomal protein L31E